MTPLASTLGVVSAASRASPSPPRPPRPRRPAADGRRDRAAVHALGADEGDGLQLPQHAPGPTSGCGVIAEGAAVRAVVDRARRTTSRSGRVWRSRGRRRRAAAGRDDGLLRAWTSFVPDHGRSPTRGETLGPQPQRPASTATSERVRPTRGRDVAVPRRAAGTTRSASARCRASRQGWATPMLTGDRPLQHPAPAATRCTVQIAPRYASALRPHRRAGDPHRAADRESDEEDVGGGPGRRTPPLRARRGAPTPTGPRAPHAWPARCPDLRSLPAGASRWPRTAATCASRPPCGTPATARWSSTASAATART